MQGTLIKIASKPIFDLPRRSYTCFAVMFLDLNLALGLIIV